jgi:hypothetical protein
MVIVIVSRPPDARGLGECLRTGSDLTNGLIFASRHLRPLIALREKV